MNPLVQEPALPAPDDQRSFLIRVRDLFTNQLESLMRRGNICKKKKKKNSFDKPVSVYTIARALKNYGYGHWKVQQKNSNKWENS